MSTDSLEMSATAQQMFPSVASVTEHHRVLNLHAAAHERHIATARAHKKDLIDFDEWREETDAKIERMRDTLTEVSSLKVEMAKMTVALSDHSALAERISEKLEDRSGKLEFRKALLSGVVAVVIAIVSAVGGYAAAHSGSAPSHAQQIQQSDGRNH